MKEESIEYRVSCSANKINKLIQTEIKRNVFVTKYNLNGEYSESGGFNLFNTSFLPYYSSEHAYVMLNLKAVNINRDGTKSKLVLKKMKAQGFKLRFWTYISFTILTLVLSIYLIFIWDSNERFLVLILPLIGPLYLLSIEYLASTRFKNLIKRIEKLLKA